MADTYSVSNALERLPAPPDANVGATERLVTLLAGAALLGYAWKTNAKGLGLASAGLLLRGATGYCPGYAAMGVNHADTRQALAGDRGVHVRESIVINASAEQLYRFWRQLDRLPEVMPHLSRVEQIDTKRSRWTAKAFDAVPVSWEAEIINEVPFDTIGWQTLAGEAIQHAGSVTFKPAPHGTEVRVHLQYAAPGGKAASWLAWMAGQDPAKLTRDGLQALKQNFEGPPPESARPVTSPSPAPIH
ncbi:MAG TPA: SRPBCC family protein [Vicinamibacterales bacterium]|nr:SRPBCC family protein [Vicinamibacterales bacterium]